MKCPNKDVLIDYLDGKIGNLEQKEQIKKHIESCQKCHNLLRSYTLFQKEGHDKNSEHHKPHEIHVSGENEGIIEEYEAELEEKFSGNQIRNLKIIGVAFTLLVMITIFGIFIWQTRNNKSSTNIANIVGVQYRIWMNANFPVNQALGEIQSQSDIHDIDNYLVFLTPGLSKILYKPKINDEFWHSLTKLLRDQNIQTPSELGMLLIEKDLFSEMESAKGSLSGDISIYFCRDKAIIIQRAGD